MSAAYSTVQLKIDISNRFFVIHTLERSNPWQRYNYVCMQAILLSRSLLHVERWHIHATLNDLHAP